MPSRLGCKAALELLGYEELKLLKTKCASLSWRATAVHKDTGKRISAFGLTRLNALDRLVKFVGTIT